MPDREHADTCDADREALWSATHETQARLITVCGEDGTNGKIGNIQRELAEARSWRNRIVAALLGSVMAVAGLLYRAGEERGRDRAEFDHLRDEVAELRELVQYLVRRTMPDIPALPGD